MLKLNLLALDSDSNPSLNASHPSHQSNGVQPDKVTTDKEAAAVLERRRLRHSAHVRTQLDHLHARGLVPDMVIRLVNHQSSTQGQVLGGGGGGGGGGGQGGGETVSPAQLGWDELQRVAASRGIASAQVDVSDTSESEPSSSEANASKSSSSSSTSASSASCSSSSSSASAMAIHRAVGRIRALIDPFCARAVHVPAAELRHVALSPCLFSLFAVQFFFVCRFLACLARADIFSRLTYSFFRSLFF